MHYITKTLFFYNIVIILPFLHFIEPTCAHAQWAHMHHFLSVCLSLDKKYKKKIHIKIHILYSVCLYSQALKNFRRVCDLDPRNDLWLPD